MWIFLDNEIDINARITKDGAWRDVDLGTNNDVPAGTKGICLHIRNTDGANSYYAAVRPNGSSYSPSLNLAALEFFYQFVQLDANRIFEGCFNNAAVDVRVAGYSDDDIWINPYVNKTPASAGAFVDVNVSGDGVPSGSAVALFDLNNPYGARRWAIRKDGTTYDSYYYIYDVGQRFAFGALSANRLTEVKISGTDLKFWLKGYIPGNQGLMFNSPVEKTPAIADSWQDVDCSSIIPGGAVAALLEIIRPGEGTSYKACVRKKGSTDDFNASSLVAGSRHLHAAVGLDSSRVFQAYVGHISSIDIFVLGYIGPPPQTITGAGGIASGEALGAPTVTPGPVAITGAGAIASAEALGSPHITPGAVTIEPEGIPSAEAFGLASIIPGLVTIRPLGISSAEAFGVPGVYRIPKSIQVALQSSRLEVSLNG